MNTPANYVGQPIRSLQTMLRTIAHADETLLKIVPDGIYGPNTVQAVREFQRQNALPVTGETDDATWNKLVAVYTVQSPSVLPAAPVTVQLDAEPHACRRQPELAPVFDPIHASGACALLRQRPGADRDRGSRRAVRCSSQVASKAGRAPADRRDRPDDMGLSQRPLYPRLREWRRR